MPYVGALHYVDPWIHAKFVIQESFANVYTPDSLRSGFKQTVRKSSMRGSDIERDFVLDAELKSIQRSAEF